MASKDQYTAAANAMLKYADNTITSIGGMAKSMADYHRADLVKFINELATAGVDAVIPKDTQ
jgi:hypothetical protein